ncbi:nucleotide disphospho-sugar-binding domain-containing protein [Streptomyces sp. V1I6]|uniref:nucleotide disphospho-sugar-binding domain-containing protein n=1 Tax=Streptomyces sp. V1I6 TaxID=3042273 RepID=UPI0027803EBC|nr:nucleotide disphospho-sugar-binding domain-containing protein [Streptomyces sp. V1I6]MDQ0841399.1 UDP:flavonoid glycosyltransferase YjiC (YdhE family) [Streptomyces sp. V1I6]
MRVLFVSYPAIGHVFPVIPLAWALRSAGHEVLVASAGDALEAANAGLHVADVSPGFELENFLQSTAGELIARLRSPGEIDPMDGLRLFTHLNDHLADGIVRTADTFRPDLIVFEQIFVSGLIAAARLGVPAVQHNFGFARGTQLRELTVSMLTETMARHGVQSVPGRVPTIDIAPPSMVEPERDGWSMRPVPYNSGAVLPEWVLEEPKRRRIGVTLGTATVHINGLGPVQRLVAAASEVDAEFVLALGEVDTAALGELPDNVRVVGWVPLTALLQTCDAAVHHGGAGTTLAALNAGVPQLILPDGADRQINAEAVRDRGAGLSGTADDLDAAVLRRLLSDEKMAGVARDVRAEIATMPSPTSLVPRLETLVG